MFKISDTFSSECFFFFPQVRCNRFCRAHNPSRAPLSLHLPSSSSKLTMSSYLEQHQWKLVNRLIRWFSWSETGFKANLPTHNNNRDAKTSLYNQLRFTEPWMRAFRSRAAEEFWTAVKSSHDRASVFANISHLFEVWPRLSPMPLAASLVRYCRETAIRLRALLPAAHLLQHGQCSGSHSSRRTDSQSPQPRSARRS